MKQPSSIVESAWEQIQREPILWDYLKIKDHSFYFNSKKNDIYLSSFDKNTLPHSPYNMTVLGKILSKVSTFANIMSRLPGTEEVTFYALINSPQSSFLGKIPDEKMLNIAAHPLTWRRERIRQIVTQKVGTCLKSSQSFVFLDIGCGAGFDSLEIERLVHRMNELIGYTERFDSYLSINVDIDSKWLENNKIISDELFEKNSNIIRKNMSAFDFFSQKDSHLGLSKYKNLIISCNGFAEFLTDNDLQKLYCEIFEFTKLFDKEITIILPFAIKNRKQEKIGKQIGFQYKAKYRKDMVSLMEKIFINKRISYYEKYSQLVVKIENI